MAMRRKRLARAFCASYASCASSPKRDQLLLRTEVAKKKGARLRLREIQIPQEDEAVTRWTFSFHTDKAKLRAPDNVMAIICCEAISPTKILRRCGPITGN
jgi:hypothetical protein